MVDKSNYRVIREHSFDEYHGNVTMQFLQRKEPDGFLNEKWVTIDCEVVDSNYLIADGTTGFCSQGWKSKFLEYIPISQGGLLDG